MNIQLLIVIVIGLATVLIVARKIYRFFSGSDEPSHCPGCSSCDIPKKKARHEK